METKEQSIYRCKKRKNAITRKIGGNKKSVVNNNQPIFCKNANTTTSTTALK
jgi:hypothetical protein